MKIVGMIPARLGSTRVVNKNLRILGDKPLVQHVVDAASNASLLDSIYINSEGGVFREIAESSGVNFYQRSDELASNSATNDDFVLDFINKIDCDLIIQILPTSPFLTSDEIDNFIQGMLKEKSDTYISVSNVQIECLFKDSPVNFIQKEQTPPSQDLDPVKAYACGLMGWSVDNFRSNMAKYSAAYHGGDGKVGFYTLSGYSTVDIDNEEDFLLAEAILLSQKSGNQEPQYYSSNKLGSIADADVKRILSGDGVNINNQDESNKEKIVLSDILKRYGKNSSWSHTVINSPSNSATLIAQLPGEGNRMHFHPEWDEWWYIVEGQWNWNVDGEDKTIKEGEIVFIERGRKHQITASGQDMAIRLAVSRYDVDHVYDEENY